MERPSVLSARRFPPAMCLRQPAWEWTKVHPRRRDGTERLADRGREVGVHGMSQFRDNDPLKRPLCVLLSVLSISERTRPRLRPWWRASSSWQ
jgi:hypothetical protein